MVFRGRDPNLIGIITGGIDPADPSINFKPPDYYTGVEGEFYNKDEFAWIDYNPVTTTLSVFLSTHSTKPGSAIMSTDVDVHGDLGVAGVRRIQRWKRRCLRKSGHCELVVQRQSRT